MRRIGRALLPTCRYLMETEVHVFAFSVSAGLLLSFFPFLTVTLSICKYVLHWRAAVNAVYFALNDYFPDTFGEFIRRNFEFTVASRGPVQIVSLILLFFTASGIFEPLEVALNRIWKCPKNRNYFKNQLVSLGLIFACGALMLISTTLTALNNQFLTGVAIRQTAPVANLIALLLFKAAAIPMSMLMLFLVYWLLPNCKIRPAQIVPAAIIVGFLLELLKYVNLWTWPYLRPKLQSEYGPFYYTVTIILWGFLAALVVLAGAEWTARRSRTLDPLLSTPEFNLSEKGPSSYCPKHGEDRHWIFTTMQPASVLSPSASTSADTSGESIKSIASRLTSLSKALSAPPPEEAEIPNATQEEEESELESEAGIVVPPAPETLEDTGLAASVLQQLILKLFYAQGDMLGRDLSEKLGLKFSLIEGIIDHFKHQRFIEAKKSLGMGNSTVLFALTDTGRNAARECLEANHYAGAAPVPLYQYTHIVRRQRRANGWLTPQALQHTYRRMVVTPRILSQIGPAVSSGNSFLIYGQPGNGKTFLAEALMNVDDSCVYVPYALDCQGTIVQVFDPLYHQPVEDTEEQSVFTAGPQHDRRWIKCRRPFIVTGGELTLAMLDLNYNATSKVYDAPYQLKANNGIYLIDDFGRQQCTPAEVLNRWIVPMERRVDYLKFNSGGKITVPFEAFLIFSTNLNPEQLGDEAFLRRIQYKMLMRSPDEHEFTTIFRRFCESRSLPHHESLIAHFIEKHYRRTKRAFRRCHPRDVLSHAIDLIHFEKLPFELTQDLLDRAFESCFLEETGD